MFLCPSQLSAKAKSLCNWFLVKLGADVRFTVAVNASAALKKGRRSKRKKPIALDFSIPKKHRLSWILRSLR